MCRFVWLWQKYCTLPSTILVLSETQLQVHMQDLHQHWQIRPSAHDLSITVSLLLNQSHRSCWIYHKTQMHRDPFLCTDSIQYVFFPTRSTVGIRKSIFNNNILDGMKLCSQGQNPLCPVSSSQVNHWVIDSWWHFQARATGWFSILTWFQKLKSTFLFISAGWKNILQGSSYSSCVGFFSLNNYDDLHY